MRQCCQSHLSLRTQPTNPPLQPHHPHPIPSPPHPSSVLSLICSGAHGGLHWSIRSAHTIPLVLITYALLQCALWHLQESALVEHLCCQHRSTIGLCHFSFWLLVLCFHVSSSFYLCCCLADIYYSLLCVCSWLPNGLILFPAST